MTAGPPFLRSIPGWLTVAIRKALGMWINLWFIHQKLCPSVIQQLPSPQPWWWENPTVKILKSIGISSAQHSRQNCVSSSALSKGEQKQRECHHLPQGWPVVGSREDQDMHSGGTAARCEKISFSMELTSSQAPLDWLHTSPHCCALLRWVSVPCVAPHWLSEHQNITKRFEIMLLLFILCHFIYYYVSFSIMYLPQVHLVAITLLL